MYLGVGLNVLEQVKESLGGLHRETNLVTGSFVKLSDGMTANSTGVLGERDGSLVLEHIVQILASSQNLLALKSMADLTAVLVVHTQVVDASLGS